MNRAAWSRELAARAKETRARVMLRFANRTLKRDPKGLDAVASKILSVVVGSRSRALGFDEDDDDLYLE